MPSFSLFTVIIVIIAIIFSAVTVLLSLFIKSKISKYIPSIISGIAASGFFIKSHFFAQGFEDIGYLIFGLIAAGIFVISILTAIVMEFMNSRK